MCKVCQVLDSRLYMDIIFTLVLAIHGLVVRQIHIVVILLTFLTLTACRIIKNTLVFIDNQYLSFVKQFYSFVPFRKKHVEFPVNDILLAAIVYVLY